MLPPVFVMLRDVLTHGLFRYVDFIKDFKLFIQGQVAVTSMPQAVLCKIHLFQPLPDPCVDS